MRMASESSQALIPITAGMMSWNALAAFGIGAGISTFGAGMELAVFVFVVCGAATILVLVNARRPALRSLQARVDG
ncbi:hypothetical protein [Haloglycomyces albus]|uniref:hypothetical protein n=1 Tax=Haloglycomyces albus TaxID=526067 RepID=UPI00046CC15D|nr:hypothetical protein [Haloglycomyces albus]